jgi:hypothetical protein
MSGLTLVPNLGRKLMDLNGFVAYRQEAFGA